MKTIIAVFNDPIAADSAVATLKEDGYNPKDMSIVYKDDNKSKGGRAAEGAASGIATGATLGAIAGLVASLVIPGLGAFFIGGPIATALGLTGVAAGTISGVATGALAGGLVGALTNLGLSDDDARYYEGRVNQGAVLVAVPAPAGTSRVTRVLRDFGAEDIKEVG